MTTAMKNGERWSSGQLCFTFTLPSANRAPSKMSFIGHIGVSFGVFREYHTVSNSSININENL
jgi:hypothetical protein